MKGFLIGAAFILSATGVDACTVCGGSPSNQSIGILPSFYRHFAGIQYQYRSFISEQTAHDNAPVSYSHEQYQSIQFWGRYNLGKRVQFLGFIPYHINKSIHQNDTRVFRGLGDITLLGNMQIIAKDASELVYKQSLQAGGGVKLPTGIYDQKAIRAGEGLPNMQPGTKSWDFIINANYTVRREKLGLNLEGNYTFTTPNEQSYKYGNRLGSSLMVFYSKEQNNLTLLPQAGIRYEQTGCDYDNFQLNRTNDMTGGRQVYASAGMQVFYKRLGAQLMYHKPFYQDFASKLVNARFKTEAGALFFF